MSGHLSGEINKTSAGSTASRRLGFLRSRTLRTLQAHALSSRVPGLPPSPFLPMLHIAHAHWGHLNTEPLGLLCQRLCKDHRCHHPIGEHECKPLHRSFLKTSVPLRTTIRLRGNLGKRSQELFLLRPVGGGQRGSGLDKTVSKVCSLLNSLGRE